jgi:hypothetical protein
MMLMSPWQPILKGHESDILLVRPVFIKVTDGEHQRRISFVTMNARGDGIY